MDAPRILGCNARWYPMLTSVGQSPLETEGRYILTVLVAGDIGDYAAYQGLTYDSTYEEEVFVARFGTKISAAEARVHFPSIDLTRYREE